MSLVFDKGKYKYSDLDKLKIKSNFNLNTNQYRKNLKKNSSNNSQINKDYESLSPYRNINNKKKNTFLTTYQNYSNITTNNKDQPKNNKKSKISKQLKYNKSFEGNISNNDLMFSTNFIIGNDDLYTIPHDKNHINKRLNNNSVILNNKQAKAKNKNRHNNKSVTRTIDSHINKNKNNLDENLIITKLDEKFKSLESNIIDKKYENDIDHDEMIISTYKKNNIYPNNNEVKKVNNNNIKLSDVINDNNINKINIEDKYDTYFINIFSNKSNIDFDENYLLNTSFENNRNDFNIMYTDNYEESVMDDMLSLEIKLLIEKMIDIQNSYHKELKLIIGQYNMNKRIFKILIEKIKDLQKKIYLIKKMNETKSIKGNIYNFIDVYNYNNQHDINKVNKKEINLWKKIVYKKERKYYEFDKEKIKDLFKKTIFDKYYKLSGKLNSIENKIILNLMKKYKYNINKKTDDIKSTWSNGNIVINNDNYKNKIFTASPIQQYKNIIKQNKNNNNNINNKKKHKKTSSCYEAKPAKYIYFKSNQQK